MGNWGRESVLFSVKLLQLLTFERRALSGARRRLEQQKEQWVRSSWRTLLLPEAAAAPRFTKESAVGWRNREVGCWRGRLAQRPAALDAQGHGLPIVL